MAIVKREQHKINGDKKAKTKDYKKLDSRSSTGSKRT